LTIVSAIGISYIDGFHGAFYYGNSRALHHHANPSITEIDCKL